MEKTTTDPTSFIQSLPTDVRPDIEALDALISEVMNGYPRVMWEGKFWGGTEQKIIGYGDLTYSRPGKETVHWFIVGLASQKDHLSIYVSAADEDGYLVKKYQHRLGKVKVGSAVISVKKANDLDLTVLRELVAAAADFKP
jgi:hypothetical protein